MREARRTSTSRSLVAFGELQRRGMTLVMGPRGSFCDQGSVEKARGGSLELEHSND